MDERITRLSMETENLWTVYVRLTNGQDREFTVTDTWQNVHNAVIALGQREEVREANFGVEFADMRAFDLTEEVASWIDGEY